MPNKRIFAIRGDTITLGQLLKAAGCVDSGSDAKAVLAEGSVAVNGETENRRGRQIHPGDTVLVFSEDEITITSADA